MHPDAGACSPGLWFVRPLTCCLVLDRKCQHCRCWHWTWSTQPSLTCRLTTSAAWSTSKALWCAVRRPGLCMLGPRLFVMLPTHDRARSCAVQRSHRAPAAAAAICDVAAAAGQGCDATTLMSKHAVPDVCSSMQYSTGAVCRRSAFVWAARHGQDHARQGGKCAWKAAANQLFRASLLLPHRCALQHAAPG